MYNIKMNTISKKFENTNRSDLHKLLLNLTDKINLKRSDKYVALSNLSMYYTQKNIKKSYKNNQFKLSAPTQNEEFDLLDVSYYLSSIRDQFEYTMEERLLFFQ